MQSTAAGSDHVRRISFGIGLAVYATSFFLPAVDSGPDMLAPGWFCAWEALAMPLSYPVEYGWILFACGLINPMLVTYLLLWGLDLTPILRRFIAIAALAFIPLNWIYMALGQQPLTPAIGHFAWVAGLLLILVPEAVNGARGPSRVPSTAAATSPAPRK